MEILATIFVLLVAIEHYYILILEMFLWTTPKGLKTFGMTKAEAEVSKSLAANMGLYNGFLATGLLWGLLYTDSEIGVQIQLFFLVCILVVAVFGGMTAKRSILFVQGLPALLALIFLVAS